MSTERSNLSRLGRPPTAFQRVLDKVAVSVFPNLANSTTTNTTTTTTTMNSQRDTDHINHKSKVRITSYKLFKKIGRLIKYENKIKGIEQELANDLLNWANNIPNMDNQQLIRDFSQLVLLQARSTIQMNESLDRTKLSLSFVHEREKKRDELLNSKFKLEKQLRDAQARFGPKASTSILISEKLEEVESALQTVQAQYDSCISTDLRETIADFAYSLYSVSKKLSDASEEFATSLEQESVGVLERVSPTKYSKPGKRSDSKFSVNGHENSYEMSTPQSLGYEEKRGPSYNPYNEGQSSQNHQPLKPPQSNQAQRLHSFEKQNIISRQNSDPSQSRQYSSQQTKSVHHDNIIGGSLFPRELPEEFNDHWGNN
ncbi:uncharacterized protein SPAPADRAFT_48352 [Spathaspora passalidarum NRRL Y-27907]|uniref:Uncharacterized protein n=1 Tax=Spathaspora passalidarum (strain NRRL Y-27907 / 11-Y1) TaxID=619300 RepID=G3AGL1_SPAPN|nr:uncharacterized protein SPAPADRAFT_48352 [Spathaspora passalidarum NRRL Y-27907]EGW35350.1 hypothetical protein SPAPADRAFT_48352 [Spathaspora passalidarum NRRL Y-27907]